MSSVPSSVSVPHARNFFPWPSKPAPFKQDSVIVITGAGSGIGFHVSKFYAKRRLTTLFLVDLNAESLNAASKHLIEMGHSPSLVHCMQCDVTNPTEVESTVAKINDITHNRIDVLVLCAGIGAHHYFRPPSEKQHALTQTQTSQSSSPSPSSPPSSSSPFSLYHTLMSVNYFGYLHFIYYSYRSLCSSKGLLVAVTSFSGEVGLPYRTGYCGSKFAITGLVEALRSELKVLQSEGKEPSIFDITVVCPPTVNTNLRKNSLKGNGVQPIESKGESKAMSVEECAAYVVDAADRRLRKAFFPYKSWLASYLRPLVPDLIDAKIIARAKM